MRQRRGVRDSDSGFLDPILPARFRRRRREEGGHFGEEEGDGGQGQGQEEQHQRGRRRWRQGRAGRGRSDELLGKAKPEMFDAWIEKGRRSVDGSLKQWEAAESVVSRNSTTLDLVSSSPEISLVSLLCYPCTAFVRDGLHERAGRDCWRGVYGRFESW
jgi:hypothetical protein